MLRRWYIPIGLLVCAAVVTVMLARDGGIYTTSTVVSFMRPASSSLSPANGTNDMSVIAFAGAVVRETNNGRPPSRYSLGEAPYYGAGVREGVLVELANEGSQWVSTFRRSDVEVKIVGRSAGWVKTRQEELVEKIQDISNAKQAALTLSSRDRITAAVVPLTTRIEHVAPSRNNQAAAAAAMLTVGLIVGAWGAITFDRLLSRRRVAAGTDIPVFARHTLRGTPS